ncbi:hypothetical protein HPB49_015793 [Dermacentor silvarum]|uniref:Uncharacterized protein n=1 Tax=Dermacentor silvarum TaxID=543639 RepID=A0ACB8D6B0_DERSI|nr:hypothetical protein HPB49_015793 [Dermacentor silvarum]
MRQIWPPNGRLPNNQDKVCRSCGARNPNQEHRCTPCCELCGGTHPMTNKTRKARFKTPYIVKISRWERQMEAQEQAAMEAVSIEPTTTPRSRFRSRRRSSYRGRSRSRRQSRPTSAPPESEGRTAGPDRSVLQKR